MKVLPHSVLLPGALQIPRSAVCDASRKTEGHVPVVLSPKPGLEWEGRLRCKECRAVLVFDPDLFVYVTKCVITEIDFL